MVFTVVSGNKARRVLAAARDLLRATCGPKEPAYIRSVEYLSELVALDPFAKVESGSGYDCCASFLHPQSSMLGPLPLESKRRDVQVLHFTGTEALSVSLKIGNTPGSPNAFLERSLGLPVTTRNWRTIVRVVERHG